MSNLFKIFIFLFFSFFIKAQSFEPSFIENAYLLDNNSGGTARYRALGGAMGALGGDLSAAADNPAGLAVFNASEFAFSLGVYTTNTEVPAVTGQRLATKESDTRLKFNQIGGALVFETPQYNWKSFSLGINSQNIGAIDQTISVGRDTGVILNPNPDPRVFEGYLTEIRGYNYRTNISFAGNYENNLYIGGSLDFYNSNKEISNTFFDEMKGNKHTYIKNDSPLIENGTGFGLSLGLIYKPIQEVRLGISYKSPVWTTLDREVPNYVQKSFVNVADTFYYRELNNFETSTHDITTPATTTMSAAYVFGKKGLISVDYLIRNYGGLSIRPNSNFQLENQFIDNVFISTSTVRIGSEYRLNDTFTFRGGLRYEQSPFDLKKMDAYEIQSGSIRTNYYGDTKGFSLGLGLKLGQNTYLDASYNYLTRDRQLFVSGEYYDVTTNTKTPGELVTDFSPFGTSPKIFENMKEINHNLFFTLGFRF